MATAGKNLFDNLFNRLIFSLNQCISKVHHDLDNTDYIVDFLKDLYKYIHDKILLKNDCDILSYKFDGKINLSIIAIGKTMNKEKKAKALYYISRHKHNIEQAVIKYLISNKEYLCQSGDQINNHIKNIIEACKLNEKECKNGLNGLNSF